MTSQQILTILMCAIGTMAMRFLPFLIFREGTKVPPLIDYFGRVLAPAVFMMLVVYCFRNTPATTTSYGIAEIAATLALILVHLWKRNTLISIAVGTLLYMFLVQVVF